MKNKIKIAVTVILTIWVQFEAIKENGYWGIGGNVLMPFLAVIILYGIPYYWNIFKTDFIDFFRNLDEMEEE